VSQRPRPRSGRRPPPRRQGYAAGAFPNDEYAAERYDASPDPYLRDDEYDDAADYDEYEEPTYRVISPIRLLLALLIAAAGAVAFFGIVIQPQLPLAVSGLGVMGVALGLLAISFAGAAASLGRRGSGGRALVAALFGGLCALSGAGALGAAIVLGLLAAGAT
jgi:hypothetical protein